MTPTLVGVGVGPGDPELVTMQAVRVLREADVVMVPVADTGEEGRAERVVRANVDRDIRRQVFVLAARANRDGADRDRPDRDGRDREAADRDRPDQEAADREAVWDAAGEAVAAAYAAGAGTVAFATIGDPNVYSTFSYLAETVRRLVPGVVVRTVPGITAMQALAAASGTVLVEGRESLVLLPLTAGVETLRHALEAHDTVVAYKGGHVLPDVLAAVTAAGRLDTAVFGAALGLPGEDVRPAAALGARRTAPYLSTLLVPPSRSGRGARL